MITLRTPILAALLLTLSFAVGSAAAVPQRDMIYGTVENRTTSGKGVSGLEIRLHQFRNDKEATLGKTKTDAAGAFSFPQIKTDKSARYAVSASYGDMEYFSEPVLWREKGASPAKLIIYETTDQAGDIRVRMHHIIFERGAQAFLVKEVLVVENPGKRTYPGDRNATPKKTGFQIPLPPDAAGIEYAPPLLPLSAGQGKPLSLTAPLKPGVTELILAYSIPAPGGNYTLAKVFPVKTDALSVVFPRKGLGVKSDQLVAEPGTAATKKFQHLVGKDLAAGATIQMALSFSWDRHYFRWVVAALMLLLMGAGLAIAFIKKKPRAGAAGRGEH